MSRSSAAPHADDVVVFGDPQLHTDGDILGLAYATDGTLWSVEEPGVVRHWNPLTGRQLAHRQLSDLETLWAFSGDARLLGSASDDLAIWDTASGRLLAGVPQPSWVTAIAFAIDPAFPVTGHDDGRVCLWDVAGHSLVRSLTPHQRGVSSLAVSPDGTSVASAGEDKIIVISRISDGEPLWTLTGHPDRIPQLVWLAGGRLLVSAGWDGTARVWDTQTGEPILLLNTHQGQVVALAASPDGRLLASADSCGKICLWQGPAIKLLRVLDNGAGEIRCLAFSPSGKHLTCGGTGRRIYVWDVEHGQSLSSTAVLEQLPASIALSPDGTRLVTNGGGRSCKVWDVARRQSLLTLTDKEAIGAVAYSPDGCWVAGAAGRFVRIWQASTGQFHATLADHGQPITVLSFAPDSQTLATASNLGLGVWLWDFEDAEPTLLIPDALDGCVIHALAFHPQGRLLAVGGVDWMATGGSNGAISFWDVQERCEVATFGVGATALAFHPQGRRLVSATLEHGLILWDVATHEELAEFDGHEDAIHGVAFSPDGHCLASGGDDRTVRLWDAESGDQLALRELDSQVKALCFAPDGLHVFTGNGNTTCYRIRQWAVISEEIVGRKA